jgi:hypothetical protein
MTILFCSEKLEALLGATLETTSPTVKSKLGNWYGQMFLIDRKRNIIFTHIKTSYAFVLLNVRKSKLKDFANVFKNALIKQLDFDLTINERQEVKIRKWLDVVHLAKSDNYSQTRIAIKDYILIIKEEAKTKTLGKLKNTKVGWGLNNHFIGTRLKAGKKKFAIPKELMQALLTD